MASFRLFIIFILIFANNSLSAKPLVPFYGELILSHHDKSNDTYRLSARVRNHDEAGRFQLRLKMSGRVQLLSGEPVIERHIKQNQKLEIPFLVRFESNVGDSSSVQLIVQKHDGNHSSITATAHFSPKKPVISQKSTKVYQHLGNRSRFGRTLHEVRLK